MSNEVMVTVRGRVATQPALFEGSRMHLMRMRMASTARRFDAVTGRWVDGPTAWFTVVAFRDLAENAAKSLRKGDPVLVHGRLQLNHVERDGRTFVSNDVLADSIAVDLGTGVATFAKVVRRRDGEPEAVAVTDVSGLPEIDDSEDLPGEGTAPSDWSGLDGGSREDGEFEPDGGEVAAAA